MDLKLVNAEQLDTDLTSVADAIRAKGGTTEQLCFPNGTAIQGNRNCYFCRSN